MAYAGKKLRFDGEGFMEYKDYQYPFFYQRFLFHRETLMENGIFFPNYIRFQDVPFMIKAMVTAGRFYAVPPAVYCYRYGHKSLHYTDGMVSDILKAIEECLALAENHDLLELHGLLTKSSHEFKSRTGPHMDWGKFTRLG